MRFDLVPNSLIRDAVFRRQIRVASGEQWRSFIHVKDAARAFVTCLQAHVNMVSGEIFNVGAPQQNMPINTLVNILRGAYNDISVSFMEAEPDLTSYRLSCSKIEKLLDFVPAISMEESLSEMRELLLQGQFPDTDSFRFHNT